MGFKPQRSAPTSTIQDRVATVVAARGRVDAGQRPPWDGGWATRRNERCRPQGPSRKTSSSASLSRPAPRSIPPTTPPRPGRYSCGARRLAATAAASPVRVRAGGKGGVEGASGLPPRCPKSASRSPDTRPCRPYRETPDSAALRVAAATEGGR